MKFKKTKIVPANANLQAIDIDDLVSEGLVIHECGITVESGATVLNGDLSVSGTVTIYGNLFCSGCANFVDMNVDSTATFKGDILFTGNSSGLVFASEYGYEVQISASDAVQNTWYNITSALIADSVTTNRMLTDTGKITTLHSGIYYIGYHAGILSDTVQTDIEVTVIINNTAALQGIIHAVIPIQSKEADLSGHILLSLDRGKTICMGMRTTNAGLPDIRCEHMALVVFMVGGI